MLDVGPSDSKVRGYCLKYLKCLLHTQSRHLATGSDQQLDSRHLLLLI